MIGIGEYSIEGMDDQLRGWLYHYEQVPSVTDVAAMTRAVRWVQGKLWVDRLEATVEARDGHSWENWRDQLQAGLSWIFPGPQKFYYE